MPKATYIGDFQEGGTAHVSISRPGVMGITPMTITKGPDDSVRTQCDITNTGNMDIDIIVAVYHIDHATSTNFVGGYAANIPLPVGATYHVDETEPLSMAYPTGMYDTRIYVTDTENPTAINGGDTTFLNTWEMQVVVWVQITNFSVT